MLTDKLTYRYERLDGDIDELVPASFARELEAHCEAMSAYSAGHSSVCNCAACAYLKFRAGKKAT